MLVVILVAALAQEPSKGADEQVVVYALPAPRAEEPPRPKPSYSLMASPRMSVLNFVDGSTVTVTFSVRNLDEQLYCAEVVWMIGEDVLSEHESDCDPYESVAPEDLQLQVHIKQFRFTTRGTKVIKAILRKNKKTLLRAEVEVFLK